MQDVFGEFENRGELAQGVESSIDERVDSKGETARDLRNPSAETRRPKYETSERNGAQGPETARTREPKQQFQNWELPKTQFKDWELELIANSRTNRTAPELRAELELYDMQRNEFLRKLETLEAELEPLRAENAAYKAREIQSQIESQLVSAARKLGCCETALRDVKRLAPMFKLGEDGLARTEDSRLAEEALADEVKLSPHWLKRSQGVAATSGNLDPNGYADSERFRAALERDDFAEALRYAPRTKVER